MQEKLPSPGQNNVWYEHNDADSVVVFVHGIFSDSRDCWLRKIESDTAEVFWPELVKNESRIGPAAIFLGGFYTALDSADYDISKCAHELFSALKRTDSLGNAPPLSKKRILFVCHSTGGIIVRYLLYHNHEAFKLKERVGLVLIASPSYGSILANRLRSLALFYRQALGLQLQWGGANLKDLDERFRSLLDEKRIPNLVGVEGYENHFILHRKLLPDVMRVVPAESAGRYFGAPVLLRKTDHFTSVKPDNVTHPAHELLLDFWDRHFRTPNSGKGHKAAEGTNSEGGLTSYYCYISKDKLDQIEPYPVTKTDTPMVGEVRDLLLSDDTFGRADVIQHDVNTKREYLRKLKLVLARHSQRIRIFGRDPTNAALSQYYFYRGEFFVEQLDEKQLIATVVSQSDGIRLVLYCSLRNFSDEPVRNGQLFLHSMNFAFFQAKQKLTFECVFFLLSKEGSSFVGSPLFLRLTGQTFQLVL